MAITTYDQLKTAVANWLDRDDLTAVIPDFITLFEAKANRALRTRGNEKRSTATIAAGDQFVELPADFRELRNIQANVGNGQPIRYMEAQELDIRRAEAPERGTPRFYTIFGDEIELWPTPDASMELEIMYYHSAALSDSETTNWLLTNHPDVYLFGALLESAPYLDEDQRIPTWETKVVGFLESIQDEADKAKTRGSRLNRRPKSV